LVALVEVSSLQLAVSMVEEPQDLSVSKLALIVISESSLCVVKLLWNSTLGCVLIRPMTACQDLRIEFKGTDLFMNLRLFEVSHNFLRFNNILEHCLDFINCIMSTFNLQFFNHHLFSIVRDTGLVKQSVCQQVGVRSYKSISSMQAAEQTHDGSKSFVDVLISQLLESSLELVISIQSNVMWSLVTLIHEILETNISGFLELHVVFEGFLDKTINLGFEVKKILSELKWFCLILRIGNDLASL